MNIKQYEGYTSFSYLKANKDYKKYALATDLNRVPTYSLHLTSSEENKLHEIMTTSTIVSLRDHGFIVPEKYEDILPYCSELHTFFHYEGIAKSGIDIIFENFMDGISTITSKNGLKWDDVIYLLGMRYADIQRQNTVSIARTYDDLTKAKQLKQTALLPSLEAASILENELDRVDILYGFGIRCMGITYNESNTLGSGLVEKRDGGLTNFGRRVVNRMNALGMIIDISHCGDQTSLDVIEESSHPVLMTHAGARALWNTPRMKPDHVLQACADKGGIIGVCAAPNTTLTKSSPKHSINSVMEHFEYLIDLVGIDHVGLGPDTFFGDHVALQHAFDDMLGISASHSGENFTESPYVEGLENPSEAMKNMIGWIIKQNYSNEDIEKVAGGNAMRVMKKILI
ncbi:diguanylate cyclase [Sporosarcina sp. PTS2304]|uniref:dipeptidase n=1 Tax=Sporosarcina sp. PTS2304 TaxID=2283194 RepID=UPI000E0CE978|nr:membrane dipeptidase [Sporosarcina sp. PTS2304]AXI00224.1 diguanylate cyclase [Sporosarcina sp. PTS2304]